MCASSLQPIRAQDITSALWKLENRLKCKSLTKVGGKARNQKLGQPDPFRISCQLQGHTALKSTNTKQKLAQVYGRDSKEEEFMHRIEQIFWKSVC